MQFDFDVEYLFHAEFVRVQRQDDVRIEIDEVNDWQVILHVSNPKLITPQKCD